MVVNPSAVVAERKATVSRVINKWLEQQVLATALLACSLPNKGERGQLIIGQCAMRIVPNGRCNLLMGSQSSIKR
eukprot:scaffold274111_cov36-Tisochrysis_lutea.AAC.1